MAANKGKKQFQGKGQRFRGDMWLDQKVSARTLHALQSSGVKFPEGINPRKTKEFKNVFYATVDGRAGQSEPLLCRDAAKEAAKGDAIIKKLPAAKKVKLENETAIRDAKKAYDELPEDSKALVTPSNVTKLEDCIAALEQVKRENEELRKENLFLKKAAAFFAKEID